MHLGRPFRNVTGILSGAPVHISPADLERVWSQLDEESRTSDRGAGSSDAQRRREGPERRRST